MHKPYHRYVQGELSSGRLPSGRFIKDKTLHNKVNPTNIYKWSPSLYC